MITSGKFLAGIWFVFLLVGCQMNDKEMVYSYNLDTLRTRIQLDTVLQNHFQQVNTKVQLPEIAEAPPDSVYRYLTFVNSDMADYTARHIKNYKSWGNFTYPTIKDLMMIYDTVKVENKCYFLVEGDILLTYEEIFPYHLGLRSYITDTVRDHSQKLVGEFKDGEYVKQENPLDIKYAIIKSTFTDQEYEIVKAAMDEAVRNWKGTCNVDLEHDVNRDPTLSTYSNPGDLTFVMKKIDVGGNFIAKSFFPDSPKGDRKILLDESFFTSKFSMPGVLRHEIGHILGFLHEHIHSDAPAVCEYEPRGAARDINDYDPKSVMHYFCDEVGTKDLLITKNDSAGAAIYYPF